MRFTRVAAVSLLLALRTSAAHALPPTGEMITPNDNRRPAGRLAGGVLSIELEARRGAWFPEGADGRGLDVAAWAESGKPLVNPGPLVRVPLGTRVRATLHNALAEPLRVYGFGAARDSVVLAPDETREVAFTPSVAGTFYYYGITGAKPFGRRLGDDAQLNGAIVVDAPNDLRGLRVGNDRVWVISWYATIDTTSPTGLGRATMAMNGLAWPHTERVDLLQGDSVRWHVVNLTQIDHPMHLHGFYFRVDAKGDGARDTVYAAADRRLAVTEVLDPRQTMTMSWAPRRPGNWVFHCHYHSHISSLASLDTERGVHDMHAAMRHAGMTHDTSAGPAHSMFGLVLGIRVAPDPTVAVSRPSTPVARPVRILVRERPNVYGDRPGYAFVFGGTADDASGALPIPARPLVLTRGEPTAITIVNTASAPATIHWHGIELDSYPDGVPGWSGDARHVHPSIRPGDSLTVRFTPPRAGTFMYHSHFDEVQQINSGLYGPILVLEPGEKYDPETDRIFFVGNAGPTTNVIRGPFAPVLLNGSERPAPMDLRAGVSYRFRFLNLADDFPAAVALSESGRPTTWRALAKDGATLPPHQATERPATLVFDPGETYDFTFTPQQAGELSLTFGHLQVPGGPKFVPVTVPVRVR